MELAIEASPPRWRGGKTLRNGRHLYWWVEALIVVVVNFVYQSIRNLSKAGADEAYANALEIMRIQDRMGINVEHGMQQWALGHLPLVVVANYFYGSVYILASIWILVFLYRRFPDDYPIWRNTLLYGTLLGLIGFATYPLMPPRLLDTVGGGAFGFVDTMVQYPTFWSFEDGPMQAISNQFAAMPSLHCGWALWGAAALWSHVRTPWGRALTIGYPAFTIYTVVITGNHFFLDAVGGLVIMVVGHLIARVITQWRFPPVPAPAPPPPLADARS